MILLFIRSFFSLIAVLHKERERQANMHDGMGHHHKSTPRELLYPEALMEGDLILQVSLGD